MSAARKTLNDEHDLAFQSMMNTHSGRLVIWNLLQESGVFLEPMHADPHLTAYNLGRAAYGRQVYARLHADPALRQLLRIAEDEADERLKFARAEHEKQTEQDNA